MADAQEWDGTLFLGQGEEWTVGFYITDDADDPASPPMDLDGLAARMQCRPAVRSTTVRFGFDSTDPDPRLLVEPPAADFPDLDPDLDPGAVLKGWVVLRVGADETAGYPLGGVFDVEVYDPDDPTATFKIIPAYDTERDVQSRIRIIAEVTR